MDISYIINELGEDREHYFNAVAPPIIQTSNFASNTVEDLRQKMLHEPEATLYTRGNNPTVTMLEKKIAALEGAEHAIAFGSGMGAVSAAVLSQVRAGDHVVSVRKPYSWTNALMRKLLPRFGVEVTMVDGTNAENFRSALKPTTKLLYLESPNSYTFELQDIEAVVAIARAHNLVTIIDNSFASPINQNPISMGVDLVVHSATKYIGGHSDTMGGVICGRRETINQIFVSEFMTLGAVLSPHDAWLLLRGLRTMPVRMAQVAETTREVVAWLEKQAKIEQVLFPFLPSHPQYELAKKQLRNNTGQFSVLLKTDDIGKVELFCNSLQHFLMAASWGGHESLIFPIAASYAPGKLKPTMPFNLVRFYIGLEDAEYLIRDIEQALDKV
ncbi:aminotransferase class I/II-fold pyridoxal phosphate-dependent enzyme [Pontibacter qinzhouensis]|uniref:Aminotransferase class I/II-fold pyridoxal phosphate-dependent enzyme n=1 Tax=Pontibacter qinzhouensis TaxID=2603253 RepID=A0A5C8KCS3_9BACT|nr:aminotransferase class I/II-fold pyridoxal phosphate-dependent enzyme [Pontibacter qinzhouensis]TXK52093.1 aminotransferase class I/II-fold pyridoxal phosphate-dependent enzyme [Pontibacter qinzhouensis]